MVKVTPVHVETTATAEKVVTTTEHPATFTSRWREQSVTPLVHTNSTTSMVGLYSTEPSQHSDSNLGETNSTYPHQPVLGNFSLKIINSIANEGNQTPNSLSPKEGGQQQQTPHPLSSHEQHKSTPSTAVTSGLVVMTVVAVISVLGVGLYFIRRKTR